MNWELILQVTIPTFAVMAFVWNKIDDRFDKMDEKFSKIDQRFEKVEMHLGNIDRRLSHLEGRFEERGYWESRKTGTEVQK